MKKHNFDPTDAVTIIYLLQNLKSECDANEFIEGADMQVFNYFLKVLLKAAGISEIINGVIYVRK